LKELEIDDERAMVRQREEESKNREGLGKGLRDDSKGYGLKIRLQKS
jgi:hypothetical protein